MTMKLLSCIVFRTVLLCGCFSSVLMACENDTDASSQTAIPFSEKSFDKLPLSISEDIVYSKAVYLKRNSIMQSMDVTDEGAIYYIQIAGSDVHQLHVLCGEPNENKPEDCMTLEYFGHGTNMAVEEAADGTYIWVGSHGNKGSDGNYGGSQTVSRIKFESGKKVKFAGGDIFHLNGARNIHPAVKPEKDLLCVQYPKNAASGSSRYFAVYKLSEAMKLPLVDIELDDLKYGGGNAEDDEATVGLTVQVKELSQLTPLYRFSVSDGGIGSVGKHAFQGYDFDGQFVYYFEGDANDNKETKLSKAYVSVLDKYGRLSGRKRVNSISDMKKLKEMGIADRGYMEAEGIKVKDGVFYLGFASRWINGNTDERRTNIFRYTND